MRFRFGTRTVLTVFTVVIIGLGFVGVRLQTVREMQHLARKLKDLDAYAYVDDGSLATHTASDGIVSLLTARNIVRVSNVRSDSVLSLLSSIRGLRQVEANGPVTNTGVRRLLENPEIYELTLRSDELSDEGVRHLSSLDNLTILRLFAPNISDDGLASLANLRLLRVLEIVDANVTDAGLQHLATLHRLEELNLSGTRITNNGLKQLKGLRNLRRLEVGRTPATLAGLAHLFVDLQSRGFEHWFPIERYGGDLNDVTLKGERFNDDVVPYLLKGIPGVTHLRLEQTDLTSEGVSKFGGFELLRKLTLQNPSKQLTIIEGLPNVERIILSGLDDHPTPEMRRMPKLTSICVEPPYAGNRIERIAQLIEESPKLVKLILGGTSIRDDDVALFQDLKQVEHLHLGRTQVTSRCLEHVSRMSNLVSLELWHTQVTDSGLHALLGLPRLRFLDLSDTSIGDASIRNIKKLTGLKELVLISTQLTMAGQRELKEALPKCDILFAGRRSTPWPKED